MQVATVDFQTVDSTGTISLVGSKATPAKSLKYIPLPNGPPTLNEETIVKTVAAGEGFRPPCRRCLHDALTGEVVHLVSYNAYPAAAEGITDVYAGSTAIFVHADEADCKDLRSAMPELPETQMNRKNAIRVYSKEGFLMVAEEATGKEEFERVASELLADREKTAYGLVFNSKPGCFAVRVERA